MGLETLQILRSIGCVLILFALALDVWYDGQDRFDRMFNGYDPQLVVLTWRLGIAIVVIAQMMIWMQ